jgi:hypothetical protein
VAIHNVCTGLGKVEVLEMMRIFSEVKTCEEADVRVVSPADPPLKLPSSSWGGLSGCADWSSRIWARGTGTPDVSPPCW